MKLKKIIDSCYLSSRFVFLYPRNRWTGNHWDSWKIREYLYGRRLWTIKSSASLGIHGKAFEQVPKPNRKYDFETVDKVKSWPWAIWFYIVEFVYEWILSVFHCIPTYTELDSMPEGWRKAFGIQMCKEIKRAILKSGGRKYLKSYRRRMLHLGKIHSRRSYYQTIPKRNR